ncbi:hypothetical protein A0J61_11717, partial [Choanephora cucurbitarum]
MMASSANLHKGIIQTPKTYKLNKKSWADAVSEGMRRISSKTHDPSTTRPSVEPGQLAESAVRDVYSHVARPFLKGTISHSLLIDISHVADQKLFIQELRELCEGQKHLWSVSGTLRREYARQYAEIAVSPSTYRNFKDKGFELQTLGKFLAYPSLSSSSEILKISLSGLPPQYGREFGGLEQLHSDMNH